MTLSSKILLLTVTVMATLFLTAFSGDDDETAWKFEDIKLIKVKTLSGDCVIEKGDDGEISVNVVKGYKPRKSCRTIVREDRETLEITEEITGTGRGGSTIWTLTVPDGIEVEFFSTSGGVSISDVQGRFSGNTASGSFEFINCRGEFAFNTASGDYDIRNSKGMFKVSSASGDIDAVGLEIDANSMLASASGSVNVKVGKTPEHDLNVGSASGRALLDYDGNPLVGYFEFEANAGTGDIDSPFAFDDEETFYKNDQRYVRKWFMKDGDEPEISIGTGSGRAVLRK
ncbi:MAG: DUF4097 family beta strand repeat protein [Candidatus Zixiibacteriota bacterium]|nr:MAG: DUF4097 family beta strand repeat protein [candidate division Zixibacteria bacterium]